MTNEPYYESGNVHNEVRPPRVSARTTPGATRARHGQGSQGLMALATHSERAEYTGGAQVTR